MKRATLLLALVIVACAEQEQVKPLSEPGEKLYPLRAVILSRNTEQNSISVDHEAIENFMPAMVMDYNVRGADVKTLPPDKSRIEARLHVTSNSYWLTDVKPAP